MDTIISILKMILGLIGGVLIGLIIAAIIIVCFTDSTFAEFITKIQSAKFGESMIAAGLGIIFFIISILILVIIHEAGHLVCGLLSGYKFVSFRIFSFTIIRSNGKLRIKRFAVAGTGGQCLLTPPDLPLDKIPTGWYNFGGVLANIIAVLVVAPFFLIADNPFVGEAIVIFILAGVFLIIINGVPMKISGAGNDAYNMIALRKNMLSKRGLVDALRANALIQEGIRPKDMPDEWFVVPDNIDYRNQLEVSIPIMAASRLGDEMEYQKALVDFERLYSRKDKIIGLYVKEIACELVFLRLICGNIEGAKALLDPMLMKYIETYRKMMSSKERILCAIELKMNNDRDKALKIYQDLDERKNDYLLQGEVLSDLAIMQDILSKD